MLNFFQKIFDFYIINFHNKRILKLIDTQNLETVVDIGCHKAELLQTLIKEDIVFSKYIGFEPIKKLFDDIETVFFDNKKTNFFNFALSSKKEKKRISIHKLTSISSFSTANSHKIKYKLINLMIKNSAKNLTNSELVKTDTLDNIKKMFGTHIDLLKIDVEGHEFEVLKGGQKFLNESKPKYIIIELQKKGNYLNYDPKNTIDILESLNYKRIKSINGPLFLFKDVIFQIQRSENK